MELHNDWAELLKDEIEKDYYKTLMGFVDSEYEKKSVFPPKDEVFNAFKYTSYKDCKCLILGQDPYQTRGYGMGLSFSVKNGVQIPKSLKNIYKELEADLGCSIPNTGDLTSWAKQGVMLLNTTLTVIDGLSNSHTGKGWETFTDSVISLLNNKKTPVVFILWGNNAKSKRPLITNPNHLVLMSSHPSPLGAYKGFWGSKPFSNANQFLKTNGIDEINWQIPSI